MGQPAREVIRCPMCDLPHIPTLEVCQGCDQPLHIRPTREEMEKERASRRWQLIISAAVIVAMVAGNLILGGASGLFVIAIAPLVWLGTAYRRLRVLDRRLARLREGGG